MNSLNDDLSKQHYGAFKYKCILMNDLCSSNEHKKPERKILQNLAFYKNKGTTGFIMTNLKVHIENFCLLKLNYFCKTCH